MDDDGAVSLTVVFFANTGTESGKVKTVARKIDAKQVKFAFSNLIMNKSEPKIRVLLVAPKRCRLIACLMTTKAARLCLYEITHRHHRDGAFFRAPAFLLLG